MRVSSARSECHAEIANHMVLVSFSLLLQNMRQHVLGAWFALRRWRGNDGLSPPRADQPYRKGLIEMACEQELISKKAAAVLLGTNRNHINVLIQGGHLSVREIPGTQARVYKSEVLLLANQSVRRGRLATSVA